ncbi:Phosphoribosylaminoimidazole-succinocarboxamide synthase [Planctomycetes bacterium Pan216]|uniref:Phosphoribosylaminoimidazole-succinocarboxamide synthase n=1 Tax=Kolteria novifilia TaxID=2527975 RepID=A0A518B9T1_9BACT|nr:Phosphoribosylaminoimidazole-succinocarboxamide synthase [Planctomycetes bacterium Pan216]
MNAVLETSVPGLPRTQGKVRDLYDLGDRLVLVASDRISAFDWVLPNGVPDKGKILTQISLFWFQHLNEPNHFLSMALEEMGGAFAEHPEVFGGRSMLAKKTNVVPIECVVRGYLSGSAWKEYRQAGTVCGHELPSGLVESSPLPEPIFTPATKATSGHDENISRERMAELVGKELTRQLEVRSLSIYTRAAEHAKSCGLILADTKFEFGHLPSGELILIDEVLTPDSSRYWPADTYAAGGPQPSFDKQFVRDWLEEVGFDKNSPPPAMPEEIIVKTRQKYLDAYERLTGSPFGGG